MTLPKMIQRLAAAKAEQQAAWDAVQMVIPADGSNQNIKVEVNAEGRLWLSDQILTRQQAEALARGLARIYELGLTKENTP